MIQNRGDFAHFDKKGGPPAREIVARADARENAVGNGQFRLSRRNKAAHLRHQHDERGLPEIRGLAAHVGPGNEKKLLASRLEAKIVGNEALALLAQQFFDHRMAPADDEKFASRVELGPRIAPIRSQFRKRSENIHLRDGRGSTPQTHRFARHGSTHIDKKLPFDLQDAFVGRQDLPLIFFQLGRSKPLGIHQRLFALVVRGSQMQIRLRNLNVVAKDLIEANLQRANIGSFAFALFHRRDDLFAVLAQLTQFIEFRVVTAADHAWIRGQRRRLVRNRAFEPFADVAEFVDFLV